jgi:hypothetical protein
MAQIFEALSQSLQGRRQHFSRGGRLPQARIWPMYESGTSRSSEFSELKWRVVTVVEKILCRQVPAASNVLSDIRIRSEPTRGGHAGGTRWATSVLCPGGNFYRRRLHLQAESYNFPDADLTPVSP